MIASSQIKSITFDRVHWMVKICLLLCMSVVATTMLAQTASNANDPKNEKGLNGGSLTESLSQSDPIVAIEKIKAESPNTREWALAKSSEAYVEDHSNPALKLEKMWANDKGTVIQLSGLPRNRSAFSAVLDIQSLRLFNLNTKKVSKYIAHMGGLAVAGQSKRPADAPVKMVQLKEGESLYVFFEPIADIDPHSLRYNNWTGGEDSYFDKIDPRFGERYEQLYVKASGKEAEISDVKDFLLQFAHNDPKNRVKPVFISLIQRLKSQNTFDGFLQSYLLIKDPADAAAAKAKASTPEQQTKINAAIAEEQQRQDARLEEIRKAKELQLAEKRKRDEVRAADLRRQEEAQQAEKRQLMAKENEARCMRTPACRIAWEEQQNRCNQSIMACRANCDIVAGTDRQSSFFGGLAASVLARGCYSACKCGSGIGDLLAKFNDAVGERQTNIASNVSSRSGLENKLKTYECKVYCKSGTGPTTYYKGKFSSRREAADYIEEHSHEICESKGLKYASGIKFSESQCTEQ